MNLPNFDPGAWAAFCQHAEAEQINQRAAAWLLYDAPPKVDIACPDCGYTRAQDEPWCRVCAAKRPEPKEVVLDEEVHDDGASGSAVYRLVRVGKEMELREEFYDRHGERTSRESYGVISKSDFRRMLEDAAVTVDALYSCECNCALALLSDRRVVHYLKESNE